MKAALLASPVVMVVSGISSAGASYGGYYVARHTAEAIVLSDPHAQMFWTQLIYDWLPIAIIFVGWFAGMVAALLLLTDHFPFGRYRLRLVPKDDPTPEVFT